MAEPGTVTRNSGGRYVATRRGSSSLEIRVFQAHERQAAHEWASVEDGGDDD